MKWFLRIITIIVMVCLIVVYLFLGGQYWLELNDLVNNKTGEEKITLEKEVWGRRDNMGE